MPAIVMSGFLDEATTEVAKHLGALAILPKSVSIEKLIFAVQSARVPCDAR